jgi:molybdopterin synthase catalytic subunit
MNPLSQVSIQTADFDLTAEVAALKARATNVGAVVTFTGTVRDQHGNNAITALELEHYPGMTERTIQTMVNEAQQRFDITAVRVIHRVGLLQSHEQIVLVAVAATHRGPAFSACDFLMDYLKTQAPFWKKEHTASGAHWVDARASDDAALARWGDAFESHPAV